jgi:hypothetical protein
MTSVYFSSSPRRLSKIWGLGASYAGSTGAYSTGAYLSDYSSGGELAFL